MPQEWTAIPLVEENLDEIIRRTAGTSAERTKGQLRTRMEADRRHALAAGFVDRCSFVWVEAELADDYNQEGRNQLSGGNYE